MSENVWGRDSCVLMVTIPISTSTVENNQRCSEKNKSVTLCETMIYFWVYAQKKKTNKISSMYILSHCSVIQNIQNIESILMSISEQVDKGKLFMWW